MSNQENASFMEKHSNKNNLDLKNGKYKTITLTTPSIGED